MARIPAETLDQIRGRLDIVELVKEFVPGLKRAGRNWKACCPFHQERTPSFTVNAEKQMFHCFGCGEGGDLVKFVMKAENLSFPEAVEELAERAGVKLEKRDAFGPQEKERLEARKAVEFAVGFYREQLALPGGAAARAYLDRRKVAPESRETFGLGWAPGGTVLLEAALRKGLTPQALQRAGLVGFKDQTGRYYDYFRERLLFPITDAKGDVLGFGGRLLGPGEPKYLNSPDTPLFSKGKVLYGIREAAPALRKSRRAVILEGYTDVIACHRFGFQDTVAPLGTALTAEHAALLKRFVEEVVVLFDPDAAGMAAALRGAELLLEHGVQVSVATLPGDQDPDEFLESRGAEAFTACLKGAVDLAEYKSRLVLAALPPQPSLAEKAKAAGQVLETVAKQPNLILRSEWTKRLAARLALDADALAAEMDRKGPKAKRGTATDFERPKSEAVPSGAEEELVAFVLRHPAFASREVELADPRARRVLEALKGRVAAGAADPVRGLPDDVPEDAGWLSALAVSDRTYQDPEGFWQKHVAAMRRARLEARRRELDALAKGRGLTDDELRELGSLARELKARGTQVP